MLAVTAAEYSCPSGKNFLVGPFDAAQSRLGKAKAAVVEENMHKGAAVYRILTPSRRGKGRRSPVLPVVVHVSSVFRAKQPVNRLKKTGFEYLAR